MTDRKNAHIRGKTTSKRQSPDVQADEAQRLLNDPAFERGFEAVREGVINELVNLKHDGQEATDNYERELCRTLRTLQSVKRAIAIGVQGQTLRLAEFQAQPLNKGE